MQVQQDGPAEILRANLDVIEALINCMEMMVPALRERGLLTAAEEVRQMIRHQRFQTMLVRGQLAAW